MGRFTWVEWLVIASIGAMLTAIVVGEVSWRRWSERHHCEQTGQTREQVWYNYVYDSKGNIVQVYPESLTEYQYACDDNQVLWH